MLTNKAGIIYLFLAVGLFACCGVNLQRQLEEFTAKEIVAPHGMRQMVEGRDSVVLNPTVGAARLVVWADSLDCSTCRVSKMFQYTEIVNYRKEVGETFTPVFVFSPPRAKVDEVLLTIGVTPFDYPVFIDENGLFVAANPHIPSDNQLHTFLLDKNGKVVLVGDPVNNPQLWEMYKKTITELIANGGTLPE